MNTEEQTFHVAKNGQTLGPYTAELIQRYLNEGRLSPTDLLFNVETQEWVALSVVGFHAQDQTPPPPPPPPYRQPLEPMPSKKGQYFDYSEVPWYRKSGINSIFVLGGLLCLPTLWITVFSLVTGNIYYKDKRTSEGALLPWSFTNRFAAIAMLVIQLFVIGNNLISLATDEPGSGDETPVVSVDAASQIKPGRPKDMASQDASNSYPITSVEQAAKEVVGTWTYVGQGLGIPIWFKWVFRADGTMDEYTASPTHDDWGKPETLKWEAMTAKYTNTGERYYAIRIEGFLNVVIMKDSQTLRFRPTPNTHVLVPKGDRFPFSK